jgi:acylphosphatase
VSDAPRALRCVVQGRVQGVFFRAATAEQAARLSLRGWARNLPDGRVEVVAAGAAEAVEQLVEWLWEGPPAARVSGVTVEEWSGDPGTGFGVR